MKPVAVSTELGSDAVLVRLIATPTTPLAGAPPMVAVGDTLVTLIDLLSVPVPPVFVTARVATYAPLSSGVKLRVVPEPDVKGLPFLVTFHAYVNVPKPVAVLVRLIAVPSGLLAGAPLMLTAGGWAVLTLG